MNYKLLKPFFCISTFCLCTSFFVSPAVATAVDMPSDSIGVERKGKKVLVLYKVEAGETLSSISRKYNTTVEAIKSENAIAGSGLKPGDVIKVPYVAKPTLAGKKVHTVAASQTLYSIARMYKVTTEEIKQWNNLTSNEISLGQQLVVGSDENTTVHNNQPKEDSVKEESTQAATEVAKPTTNASGDKVHVVEAAQGLFSIARMYNIPAENLRKWNNLSSDNLKVGQELLLEAPEQIAQAARQETPEVVQEAEKPTEKEVVKKENKETAQTKTEPTVTETQRTESEETVAETKPAEKPVAKKEEKTPETNNYTIANTSGYVKKVESGLAEVIDSGNSDMFLALHRSAPVGTIMQVRNQMNDLSVFVKVIGKLPDTGANDKVVVKISKKAYDRLAAIDKRFRVELSYMP